MSTTTNPSVPTPTPTSASTSTQTQTFMATNPSEPSPSRPLPPTYHLIDGYPSIPAYLTLRSTPNLSPKTAEQAALALPGSWFGCYVVHTDTDNTAVGMGRIIGDGGWYFHIVDMAVAPEHQRRGIGDAILSRLLERIREVAPPGALVSLLADPPGKRLYAKHGFVETAPGSVAMAVDF
ncbi:hypothetical protein AJ79_01030 [Helicocarpus griseus UAMH5409]|uniref:N-acetyltransferase domain-containing protein n=1 Tax=Helicocarpus griseus UAMH5409 TaxID=1447875 RepID=A0A2B7Y9S2_9EURO|nr:hypothetical protein AJ79_01030 [Helicocarpus griseus UAMH5409]